MTTDPPALRRTDWEPRLARRHPTRPEQAADQLAELAASLEPGQRLGTKEDLRTSCGVSVGTFNEALRMVQARGLITVRSGPGGGLFASRQSPMVRLGNSMLSLSDDAASVAEAVRLRNALDPLLVEDAIEHASAHDVAALRAKLDQMKVAASAADSTTFIRTSWDLHARIAEISPSAILRSLYLNLLEIIDSHLLAVQSVDEQPLPDYVKNRYQLHVDLVDAIADRDPQALQIIKEHNTSGADLSALSDARSAHISQ